jgi:polysaccharide transporter, PST family
MLIKVIKKLFKAVTYRERTVVLENFLSLSTFQGISYLLPAILLPYLIRVIGPEKFGLISFAQAFVQYFMIFTDYGFNFSASKEISLCRENKDKVCSVFSSVIIVKSCLVALSLVLLLAIIHFIPKFKTDSMVYLLSFGVVIGNSLFPVWFFQGTEKMKYTSGLNVAAGITILLGIFFLVKKPEDYLLIPLIYSIVYIINGITALLFVFYKFKVRFKIQAYKFIDQQLKSGWNIFVSCLAINAYTTTRIFAVGLLTNNVLTGYYSIAERISGIIQTFPLSSFSQAVYPRLSKIYKKSKLRALNIMYKVQDVTNTTAIICLPILFILAPLIIRFVCAYPYHEVVLLLRLLILSLFFINANAFKVQFLLVSGRTDLYSKIHVGMALVALPLIFISIFLFSYIGAALVTIIIEMGIMILTSRKVASFTK